MCRLERKKGSTPPVQFLAAALDGAAGFPGIPLNQPLLPCLGSHPFLYYLFMVSFLDARTVFSMWLCTVVPGFWLVVGALRRQLP